MKRAPFALLLASLLLLRGTPAVAQEAGAAPRMLQRLNELRQAGGIAELQWDETLARTAADYGRLLGQRGELSHRDPTGGSALQRYHAQGGTAVLVGELLGAGPHAAAVAAAWRLSPPHREVLLDRRFTHAGAGFCPLAAGAEVWVVVFARRLVEPLLLRPAPQGYCLEGRFLPAAEGVLEPFLLSGIRLLAAERWQPEQRWFRFLIPQEQGDVYHRLGYRSAEGEPLLTDVFFPAQLLTCAPGRAPR